MAPRKNASSSSPIKIGNCDVSVEAKNFTCKSDPGSLRISLSKTAKITISVREDANSIGHLGQAIVEAGGMGERRPSPVDEYSFMLVNPKDADTCSKSYLQEVLQLYMRELPTMNYAANTGKESKFMERCVFNGKYSTLLLKSTSSEESGLVSFLAPSDIPLPSLLPRYEVLAAISYQIIPADTRHAEIPLAAVTSSHQNKGFGHVLYMELRRRLQSVGVRTIFCWGDTESEGFWTKQDFVSIAEVDTKGRARRLPIKADIRRALCFPGGSTLMVSHLKQDIATVSSEFLEYLLKHHDKPLSLASVEVRQPRKSSINETPLPDGLVNDGPAVEKKIVEFCGSPDPAECCRDSIPLVKIQSSLDEKDCSVSSPRVKKRVWEASVSSLKSKRVKASSGLEVQPDLDCSFVPRSNESDYCLGRLSQCTSNREPVDPAATSCHELQLMERGVKVMLMNIADESKKTNLAKVIEDLGGTVSSDGSASTHVVTGKVRRTLNFSVALCSGAWIVSPNWLKESFRHGRFVDELPFILNDEEYESKYKADLRSAILRARASPGALLKGYHVCLSSHVHPPAKTLSTITTSAGGSIIRGLKNVKDLSKTIFLASEEDMEEALTAVKKGVWTFSSDWLMNCVMRQELDLDAPQFAESL